jgi:hypothetical protein
MGIKEKANEKGEKFLKGRTAGVEKTFGTKNRGKVAENTIIGKGDQRDSGSLDSELGTAASSLYTRAVVDAPDPSKMGDQAMYKR